MRLPSFALTASSIMLGILALSLLYWPLVTDPGSIFFASEGDGLKNYYTFAYHIAHDESALHFEGMNHPYGEHIVYTDAQPAFSIPLQFLARAFPQLAEHSIALLNLLMLLDLVLCVVLFAHVLRAYGVPGLFAVVGALGIALLSPQILRMYGHFGLAYSSFLPLVWLLILKLFGGQRRWQYALLLSVCIFVLFLVHPYLGLIGAGFAALYGSFDIAHRFLAKHKLRFRGLFLLFPAILATFLFQFITTIGRPHGPRDPAPGGIDKYLSSWMSVMHPFSDVPGIFTDLIIPGTPGNWEGIAYWGLGTMLALIIAALFMFRHHARNAMLTTKGPSLTIPVLAAMSMLIFSFGWHLDIPGVLESPLAQFRTLGRFAWPSYYVLGVTAIVLMYRLFNTLIKNKVVRVAITLAFPLMFCYEGAMVRKWAPGGRTFTENSWTTTALQQKWGVLDQDHDLSSFKACIPLPYFHNGSERVLLEGSDELKSGAFSLSIYSGIPLMASDMARTPYTEARALVQAMGSYSYLSSVSNSFAKGDSLLVVLKGPLTKNADIQLLQKCEPLGEYGGYDFYFLLAERLFNNEAVHVFEKFRSLYPDTALWDGRLLFDTTDNVIYRDFEYENNPVAINGRGSWNVRIQEHSFILDTIEGVLLPGKEYIASLWSERGMELDKSGYVVIECRDRASGEKSSWNPTGDTRSSTAYRGAYALSELVFSPKTSTEQFKFIFKGNSSDQRNILLDDALIRPLDSDVYKVLRTDTGMQLMHNGCFYNLPEGLFSDASLVPAPDLQ